jgi:hypothetical protein
VTPSQQKRKRWALLASSDANKRPFSRGEKRPKAHAIFSIQSPIPGSSCCPQPRCLRAPGLLVQPRALCPRLARVISYPRLPILTINTTPSHYLHKVTTQSLTACYPRSHSDLSTDPSSTRCPPSIMNRLFGAKNTAPKPTLNQAIEGVRRPTVPPVLTFPLTSPRSTLASTQSTSKSPKSTMNSPPTSRKCPRCATAPAKTP